MSHVSPATLNRLDSIQRATDAVLSYDTDNRIETAQMELEFDEGIKVANDVLADFIADLHHLSDYHGQDFDEILANAWRKYNDHQGAVAS